MTHKIITVVAGLAVNTHGQILLCLRPSNKIRPSLWETAGGKVEPTDTSKQTALCREWREELGCKITVPIGPAIASTVLEIDDGGPWGDSNHVDVDVVVHLYPVTLWDAPRPLEHADTGWFRPDFAMKYLPCSPAFYGHYRAIRRYVFEHERGVS